jgi:Na+/proline symporter
LFVILAGLVPLTIVGLRSVGGLGGLQDKITQVKALGPLALHPWEGTGVGNVTNPIGANWLSIGFVLSFGYWTTNFAEVQRALAAKNLSAARRTPLIAAFPKLFIPFLVVVPGLIAAVTVQGLGAKTGDLQFNNAIPILISKYLPSGMLAVLVLQRAAVRHLHHRHVLAAVHPWAGFWGLAAGTLAAVAVHFLHSRGPLDLGSPLSADFWGAVAAFVVDAVVTVVVSLFTRPKPDRELHGLVWGLTETGDDTAEEDPAERVWWRRPVVLGAIALALTVLLYLIFLF